MQFPYGRRVPMQEPITTDAIIAICWIVAVCRFATTRPHNKLAAMQAEIDEWGCRRTRVLR
jgi:hypothetical protein